ncbi:MAG: amidohydrolase family protein [Proteobacteria bacterium]|nr:amidohydrolase family protein [Pseudomonadota bacterium]
MPFDTLIKGGTVIDGTGSPAFTADIAVKNGKIAEIGRISGRASRVIDADGALVIPGLVDIHTHYDGQATWANRLSPSSHHGVTTVVAGNCGVGFAPVRPHDREKVIELMEGVEDIPGAVLNEGLSWEWESFPQYMDFLDGREFDMDIGVQIPHAPLRVYVMGQRGLDREAATPADITRMKELTREAIAAGAIGFSSSRSINHRSSKGDHTPSLKADLAEMAGIAAGIREAGHGVIELISDFFELDEEFDILEGMAASGECPLSFTLAEGIGGRDGWRRLLARIEKANENGLTIRGQIAPRAIGLTLGLTTSFNPFSARPTYRKHQNLPLAEKVARLAEPAVKAQILTEPVPKGMTNLLRQMRDMNNVWQLGERPDYEPLPEDSIGARAKVAGRDPMEFVYDKLLENGGRAMFYMPATNYFSQNLDCCREMILHEHTLMGLGDGGAHVGIICDASFPTFGLTHWGRDRTRGDKIELTTLVQNQTRATARAVGLHDRGELSVGMRADVNVIDFDNLAITRPEMVNDLPSGAGRLQQKTIGYLATMVNGGVTYEHGEPTDALPGRLVRAGQ